MRTCSTLALVAALLIFFASCKKDDVLPPPPPNPQDSCHYFLQNVDMQLDTCYGVVNLDQFTQLQQTSTLPSVPQDIVTAADGSFLLKTHTALLRSTDQGDSWQQVRSISNITHGRNIDVSASGEVFLGLAQEGLFRSNTNGASYTSLPANGLPYHRSYDAFCISVAPNNDIYVYLGWGDATDPDSLFRSTDGGINFSQIPLPGPVDASIIQNQPINHALNGRLFLTNENGIFWTDDNGQNWTNVYQTSYPGQNANTWILNDGRVYCTLHNQSYLSTDNGNSFQPLNKWIISLFGTLPNGYLVAGVGYQNAYVVMSPDNGYTWGEFSGLYALPTILGINDNGAVAFVGSNQANWDINQTFWTCRSLPDEPSLGPWKDMDIEGSTIVLVAGTYPFVSTNRGATWTIGAKLPWDATCVDYAPSANKIMVGVGVSGGSPLNGNCYFLNGNGTSILGSISTGTGMNVHDVVFFNDDHWVVSLGWEPASHGYVLATTDGGGNYLMALENVIGTLPRTLYYDPSHLLLYAAAWSGFGWDEGWDYQRYDYDANVGYEYDWEDFRPEFHYANGTGSKSWARQPVGGKMFLSLHFNNVVQYNDVTRWMFKTTTLNLPEPAEVMKFDDLGYLWVLTANGLYKSNQVPSIQ